MKTDLNFRQTQNGNLECKTDIGTYRLWKDWKNNMWVIDCPDGDTVDFGSEKDAIEAAGDDYYNRTSAI